MPSAKRPVFILCSAALIRPVWHSLVYSTHQGVIWLTHCPLGDVVVILSVISKHMLRTKFISTSCELALKWTPKNTFDDMSTLVQVMAWCCQASSHYLSQCWHRSKTSYGITRPKWVDRFQYTDRVSRKTLFVEGMAPLTHWGQDKMATISQTFWNAFSWLKMYEFWLRFH